MILFVFFTFFGFIPVPGGTIWNAGIFKNGKLMKYMMTAAGKCKTPRELELAPPTNSFLAQPRGYAATEIEVRKGRNDPDSVAKRTLPYELLNPVELFLDGREKKLKKFASKCLTVVDDVLWFPPPSNRSHNKQRCEPTNTYRDCHKNGRSSWDARNPIFKSQRFPRTPSKEGAHGDHEYSLLIRCQRVFSYNDYSLSEYSPRVKSRRLFSPSGSN